MTLAPPFSRTGPARASAPPARLLPPCSRWALSLSAALMSTVPTLSAGPSLPPQIQYRVPERRGRPTTPAPIEPCTAVHLKNLHVKKLPHLQFLHVKILPHMQELHVTFFHLKFLHLKILPHLKIFHVKELPRLQFLHVKILPHMQELHVTFFHLKFLHLKILPHLKIFHVKELPHLQFFQVKPPIYL